MTAVVKPRCVLVSGSENRHRIEMCEFGTYLKSVGCAVNMFTPWTALGMLLALRREVRTATAARQPLLLAYIGHGGPQGWGPRPYTHISYIDLAHVLGELRGPLMVLNDTCYGKRFQSHLTWVRGPTDTGFVSAWDSDDICFNGVVRDAREFWARGRTAEEVIRRNFYVDLMSDVPEREVPVQHRWGAPLDSLFYPATAAS